MISRRLGDTSRLADSLKISLVTGDAQLLELCREAVRELALDCVDIVVVSPHQDPLPRSDLLIWDTDFTDRSRRMDQGRLDTLYHSSMVRHRRVFMAFGREKDPCERGRFLPGSS